MPKPAPDKLPRREREILDILFASPEGASAEDVRARLSDPLSSSAVRTMLQRLEEKGFVRHRAEGLRYVYVPTASRSAARRAALQQLVRVFFGGSPGETAAMLLKHERWTDDDLDALQREIQKVRKERNQP